MGDRYHKWLNCYELLTAGNDRQLDDWDPLQSRWRKVVFGPHRLFVEGICRWSCQEGRGVPWGAEGHGDCFNLSYQPDAVKSDCDFGVAKSIAMIWSQLKGDGLGGTFLDTCWLMKSDPLEEHFDGEMTLMGIPWPGKQHGMVMIQAV